MADRQDFWTEERLKKAIIWVVVGIVVVVAALFGWWYYLNKPVETVPKILADQIAAAQAKVKKNPKAANVRLELASLYLQAEQYTDAREEALLVLKMDKKNAFAMTVVALTYNAQGKISKAVTYYKQAIAISEKSESPGRTPAFTESVYRLGKIYFDQNKHKEAIKLFEKSVSWNSIDSDARYQLGRAYLADGQYDKAIEHLEVAVKFVPEYFEAQYALGQAYEKKGDEEKAIKAYMKAVEAKADYTEAKDALDRLQK